MHGWWHGALHPVRKLRQSSPEKEKEKENYSSKFVEHRLLHLLTHY